MKRVLGIALLLSILAAGLGPVQALDRQAQQRVMAAVVQISWITEERDGLYGAGVGSGTIISPDGLILTNCHVADPLRMGMSSDEIPRIDYLGVSLTTRSDQLPKLSYLAEVVAADPYLDLAVIRITRKLDLRPVNAASLNLPYLERGSSDDLEIGDELNIFGYPGIGGETLTFTRGVVSGFTLDASITGRAWIKTDTTIAGGNSGGTAVNQDGLLVGVPTEAGRGGLGDRNEYVDCRPVADTNGNNRLDSGDTCVPIGGFINALRPVNLAEPLVQAALAGLDYQGRRDEPDPLPPTGEVLLDNLFFSPGVNEFDQPTSVIYRQPSGARSLYLFFDYEHMADGMTFEMVARVNGREEPDLSMPPGPWTGGPEGSSWVGYEDQPLPDGRLELSLLVDGVEAGAAAIQIGGRPETLPTFSNLLFSLSEAPDGGPGEPAVLFPAGTEVLYAFFDYANMRRGTSWTSMWLAGGEVALSEDAPWDGAAAGNYAIELSISGGLEPGAYRLELYIDDLLAATSGFWVTDGANGQGSGAFFEPIIFAEGMDRRGEPVAPAETFVPGLEELHAFSAFGGMEDGLNVVVNWYLNGEKVVEWPYTWAAGQEGLWHDFLYAQSGTLPEGEYGLELTVEGQLLQQGSTTIGVAPQPTPAALPSGDVPAYGTVTDAYTGRPVRDVTLLLLEPGITVDGFNWVEEEVYTAASTDRQGYFEFPRLLVAGTCYSIIVGAEGYWPFAQDDVCIPVDQVEVDLGVQLEPE